MSELLKQAMIKPDRQELLIAAVTGAVIGVVAGYLDESRGLGLLIWAAGSQPLSAGWFIFFGVFVSACPPLVASRHHGQSRNGLPASFC